MHFAYLCDLFLGSVLALWFGGFYRGENQSWLVFISCVHPIFLGGASHIQTGLLRGDICRDILDGKSPSHRATRFPNISPKGFS